MQCDRANAGSLDGVADMSAGGAAHIPLWRDPMSRTEKPATEVDGIYNFIYTNENGLLEGGRIYLIPLAGKGQIGFPARD